MGREVEDFREELGGRDNYDQNILYKIFKGFTIFKKIISESVAVDWGETLDSQAARWTFALP